MDILYAGGLWTVVLISGVLAGYNWALNGSRRTYWLLLGAAIVTIAISQLLPDTHLFNKRIAEGLHWWRWALTIAVPVLGYAMVIRWIKRKANARHDS